MGVAFLVTYTRESIGFLYLHERGHRFFFFLHERDRRFFLLTLNIPSFSCVCVFFSVLLARAGSVCSGVLSSGGSGHRTLQASR